MTKRTNILSQPHFIHIDKLHIQIDDNSIINFELSHPFRLKQKDESDLVYKDVYEIQYYQNGIYNTIGYLNHQMRIKKQSNISNIYLLNYLLYSDWLPLAKELLSQLKINDNYKVSGCEIALDTNENLIQLYYNLLINGQIILRDGYVNPVFIPEASNRFVKIGSKKLDADTIYIEKYNGKGRINHYNKTRIENKSAVIAKKNKSYILTKLSKKLDTDKNIYRIEQVLNLCEYSKATRNNRYYEISNPYCKGISKHKYLKLSSGEKDKYEKHIIQIDYSSIKIENLNNYHYLLVLFNHFTKFNFEFFLGCPPIEKISFDHSSTIISKTYISTNFDYVFDLDFRHSGAK